MVEQKPLRGLHLEPRVSMSNFECGVLLYPFIQYFEDAIHTQPAT